MRRVCVALSRIISGVLIAGVMVGATRQGRAASCTPLPSGVVGWWAGEGNGNDVLGINNGSLQGGVSFVGGEVGQAFVFNGTNSYVQIPDARGLSPHVGPNGELTLELWLNFSQLPQYDVPTGQPNRAIVVKGSPGQWEYGFYITTNAQPVFAVWQLGGSGYTSVSANPLSSNQWHHLAGVLRKGQFAQLYVDGQLVGASTSFSGDTGEGSSPLYLGRRGDGQYFNGAVDEVSLYGRALGAGEVAAIYNAGAAGKCPAVAGASVPYFTDFESGAGPEWMLQVVNNSESLGFTRFSGPFYNSMQMLTMTNLVPGQTYTLGFDFYAIDAWNGNPSSHYFNVLINGSNVFSQTFANYNGNPPNSAQSFPGQPDEGRANFGFNPSYVDAIYRNIEVQFVASNALTTFQFSGQNVDPNNLSWGLDNVSVQLSANLTNTFVRSTSLPDQGSTNSADIENFTISANWPLSGATATNPANYTLVEAGGDGIFGTADDVAQPLTLSTPGAGGRSIAFALANPPLQPGHYRLQTTLGLQGTNGSPVPVFSRDFFIVNPVLGTVESTGNNTLAAATALPVTESPNGSGFFTAFALGTFSTTSDVDYWRFNAEAGDVITVRLESESLGVYPQMALQNATGGNVSTAGGDYGGTVQIQDVVIGTPGTYYVRVWSNNNRSRYRLRLDQSRGPQLEAEDNSTQANANQVNFTFSPGLSQGRVAGSLPVADSGGDFYRLNVLNTGNTISVTPQFPSGSVLNAAQLVMTVQIDGNPVDLVTNQTGNLNYTISSNGLYYVHVSTPNADIRAQYLLNINIGDVVPPLVTGTTLPAEGSTTSAVVDRFSLTFSEYMNPAGISNSASYELRSAGPDGVFGTADDALYTVVSAGYPGAALVAPYLITDGPLQPGKYRLTVSTNLTDLAANKMAAPFVLHFTVANLPGYILEARNDAAPGLGTLLSFTPGTNGDGTVGLMGSAGVGSNPQFIAAGRFGGDTNLDLVTANYNSANVTVLTNNGRGVFQVLTNLPTGGGAISVVVADFNNDGFTDMAVANYAAGTVSIILGRSGGAFQIFTNYNGFSGPYNLAATNLTTSGKIDLIVPNYNSGTVSVLLGNGDGTFQPSLNYATGSGSECVAVGDLNGDGKPDLVVANYNSSTLTILTNGGSGTFQLLTNMPVGPNPRYVAVGDVTGDNVPDLVVLQSGNNSIGLLPGNGNGTFQARLNYLTGTQNPYQFCLADLNGDGRSDIVVPGYGNNVIAILLNNGTGVFTNLYTYGIGQNPIAVAAGDFNNDGRVDLAFVHYYGNYVSIWAGDAASILSEDPPGSGLRTALARGNISNPGEVDYYQFFGNAGDQVLLAVETPGEPPATPLNYQIQRPDGSTLLSFNANYNGYGQSGVLILPQSGTYVIRVAQSGYDYEGEYRIRITLARPPIQLVNESNNSMASANAVALSRTNGSLAGTVAGYLSVGGGGGDFYALGNLLAGSVINLKFSEPASSGMAEVLSIYNAAGMLLTNSAAGVTNFAFTVPAGQSGQYYVQITGAPGGFAGNSEAAIRLSGGSDYIALGNWFDYQVFTISMWINPGASQNSYADLIDNNHSSVNWVVEQNASSVNQYSWGVDDGSGGVPFSLAPNTWQHLDITRDATNVNRVYINGVLAGTAAGTGQIFYDGTQYFRIGTWGRGGGRGWNGIVDEVRVWDRDLSQAEVIAGMSGKLTGNEPNLVGYWPFDEGFGTNSVDLSPSNHVASLVNGASWIFLGNTNAARIGLTAQYLLSFNISNAVPPQITGVTLPANGSTNSGLITSFSVGFNEDMDSRFTWLARKIYHYNSHSYLLTDSAGTWWNTEQQAIALGGHLTAINSAAENGFLNQTFNSMGDLWIGLNELSSGAGFLWTTGEPFTYSNWSGGNPDNANGYEPVVKMYGNGNGTWDDIGPGTVLPGIIEVASSVDTDGDGLPDSLDPYPNDPLNAFDLRAAGPDGLFGTADDIVYHIYTTGYASGITAPFVIADGPLQPGYYRFEVTTSLTDRFGNPLPATFIQNFTIAPVNGFVEENRRATNGISITSLSLNPSNGLDGSFSATSTLGTGRNPYFLTAGHFNSDANLDLVTANYNDGNVTVFLGDGRGGFQALTNISTGGGAVSIVTGDFNHDNKTDLAVANYASGTVSILLGDGTGSFQVLTNYSGFSNPFNLATADFNGDHNLDLVVPNFSGGNVAVLLGNGDGTFRFITNYPVGSQPETVAVGDLNNDGRPDLVVANYNSGNISVLLGNTDGTFQGAVNYGTPGNTRYVTLGNVNGDTNLDVVAVNDNGTLSVFFGQGDGTLQTRADYGTGTSSPYQVQLADVNGDGKLDAVVAGYGNSRLATVLNNGDGTFGPVVTYFTAGNPISVAIGDFNNDGRLDVATANYNGNSISVFLGNNTEGLAFDTAGTGLRIAAARGNLADSADYDYWTFSAQTGDRLFIGTDNPGDPANSGLIYRIFYPDGSQWSSFSTDSNGRGQIALLVPASGTYSIRVEQNYAYAGEYRLRVTLAPAPVQMEAEDNGSIGNANALTFAITSGQRTATVLGFLSTADAAGDFYQLGDLATGTQITLGMGIPATSRLAQQLEIYNAAGNLVTNSQPGQTNLVFMVPTGAGGPYYAHVLSAYPARASAVSNALFFNGSSTYVDVGAWAPGAQWTVQAWVLPTALPGGRRSIAGGLGGCEDWAATLQDGFFGTVARQPGGCSTTYESPVTAPDGAWAFVSAISDGTNAYLYVNGNLITTGPVDPSYTPYTGGTRLGSEACCGNFFPGIIQDVSIWGRALSATEVNGFMTNSPTGSEAGLLGYWRLQDGAGSSVSDLSTNGHNGTLINSPAWISLAPFGTVPFGLMQQYLLTINLLNTIPPQIVSVNLPAEGTVSSNIIDRFAIVFSEDMAPATVTNAAYYELRNAGPDNTFGTADDQLYTILNSPVYTLGTNASYLLPDAPLQPGLYRFTAKTNITDPTGTFLAAPYVRNFSVVNIPGFVLANRFDNSFALATSLSLSRTNRPDGSFLGGATVGLPSGTERIAAGRLGADTNIDLIAAQWQSGSLAVLRGNGDGTFQLKTNYSTGSQAWSVALGNFNADANLDVAIANYGANTISIFTGNPDATFRFVTNYSVGTNPYHIVVVDFNKDGKMDLAVPNVSSGNVSILLGNGDGTFQPAVNYGVGNSPMYAAVGDVNGDGRLDLVVVNNADDNLTLLLGNGDGTFGPPLGIASGIRPRAAVLSDLNNDGKLDLAVFNGGDNTISVMLGNGDGSFQPRINYGVATSDGYEILAVDVNGDGWKDLVVDGYYNSAVNVLLNRGNGSFQNPLVYYIGNHPVGLVAADFNNDGRVDLALGNDSGNSVSVLLGNDTQPLTMDAATGLRVGAGRGNMFNNTDVDYWSFDASAGEQLFIASENPGYPGGSGLCYTLFFPDGRQWTSFCTDYFGRGQIGLTIPADGTYRLAVTPNYQYYGEYHFRVTLAPNTIQTEVENNDSIGNANAPNYVLNSGHRRATMLGMISNGDPGDFYQLGTLADGATINLSESQPASSGLLADLVIYNSAASLVAYGPAGAPLSYTIPPGAGGSYYAQIWDAGPASALTIGGVAGNALRFGAGGDWISFTNGIIPSSGDFTVECWAYAYGSSGYRELVSQGTGGNAFYLGTDGGNIRSGDGWQSTGVPFPFAGWHHLAIVKSSTNTLLFVDGTLSASQGGSIPNPAPADGLRIGRQYDGYGEYWWGLIDEVRIWSVARAASDIQLNMSNRLTGAEAGLVGYWRFDEGAGMTVTDSTAAGNTGAFQGTPVWVPSGRTNLQPSNIFSQYLLSLDLADTTPAAITGVTLPGAGSTNSGIIDRFTLSFSKQMDPAINALNRYIRTYNGHGYTISDTALNWYDAETQARALGGHLVSLDDALENGWVYTNFNSFGTFWIGLNDEARKGTYVWSSGEPVIYTNWDAGQPNNSSDQDYGAMRGAGVWADYPLNGNLRGVFEVAGPDSDGDGIPDSLDPYPFDPYNVFDLRTAGPDGLFDTPDDIVYHFTHANYTGGLSLDFSIIDGPLQPGYYRFMVTSSFHDQFGNPLAPFIEYFTVTNVPGYVLENRGDNSPATATPLSFVEDPVGMKTTAGRGNLSTGSEADYWSFSATAGDLINLATFVPGSPGGSQLHYQVLNPNGSVLIDFYPSYVGDGQSAPATLPVSGTYLLAVSPNYNFQGEYRFRLTTATPPLQMEAEDNGTIAKANVLNFTGSSNGLSASVVGEVHDASDLDYYNLGTVTNGASIFLNTRLPASSALLPIVSVYNLAGVFQTPASGTPPNSGAANVPITTTDTYFALVRGGNGTGGLKNQYVLDVNVVPTGSLNFPNLVVSRIGLPTGAILSGQPTTYSFTVQNVGTVATDVGSWIDRTVMDADQVLGNSDDIPIAFLPHTGDLNPGNSYSVTNTFQVPDGISGDFYLIIQADAGNAVNEYVFAANKTSVSTNTFHVTLAPYPDLTVQNLNVSGPDANHLFTITWNSANIGSGPTPAPFYERMLVRDLTTGNILINSEQLVTNILAPSALLPHLQTVVATNGGTYQVQITTDSRNSFYEDNTGGNAAAVANNIVSTNFQIISFFNVTLQAVPSGSGTLSGAGTYSSGSVVTVGATPNTNSLPYGFVNWTEGGVFQSASPSYSFVIAHDRTLNANFTLPTFLVSVSNNPPAGGTVAGQGNYFYGTTNVLTATANYGYRFTNWTAGGNLLASVPFLTNVVTSNVFVVANYAEANTFHVVTTGTSPTNVAVVSGAGTYTNGQTATITAQASVTNPPSIYNFRQFQLNGSPSGNNASFGKTFSTLDPTNVQFIAFYDTVSILPLVTNVVANYPPLVPATTNFILSLQFNRSMDSNFPPVIVLTNPLASVQAVVPPGGIWSQTVSSNDTFTTFPITFATGMDGTDSVLVSQARDLGGAQLAPADVMSFVVDVTPPANPILTLAASNSSSATVSWSGYAAPPDLNGFRAYIASTNFNSVSGLVPVTSLGSGARSFTYSGLSLDQPYYVAAVGVDNAGNSSPVVVPLAFSLPSTVPPPVVIQVAAVGASSALVSWNAYNPSALLGFAGFQLYYETSPFATVTGHVVRQVLGTAARSVPIDNLDRTKTYYFAVVGFNGNNAFNPNVTTASWSDPYAGTIASNLTIGGGGQASVNILQNITVVNNAVITIPAGTKLYFAPGTGLAVQQGALNANGTPLDPIIFTSANDQPGLTPAPGDWNGLSLGSGAGASLLRNVFVNYGGGLTLSNCAPVVDAFTALYNMAGGLILTNGAALNTTNAQLELNGVGAEQLGSGQLTIVNSVIKNNGTNALAFGGLTLHANQDWWGSATSATITAQLQGAVDSSGFLSGEPLLTPAIGISNNVTQVGTPVVNLRLACRTADSMRLSEDSTFNAVFFSPFSNSAPFQLSAGGGQKTIFAQFRSITGQTSAPVSLALTYITLGPTISSFNLFESEVLGRPLLVTGSATAPLGMNSMEFHVDGVPLSTNAGGSFSYWFDVRNLSSAIHRVELLARDNSGNIATVDHNVVIAPTPPPVPMITTPASDLVINTNNLLIQGSAEPFIQVRLFDSGTLVAVTNADANGSFTFARITLSEGLNQFTALAIDSLGSASSLIRSVTLDTMPPAALVMNPPTYRPGVGLNLTWQFAASGKQASVFQAFWSTVPITNVAQAAGSTLLLNGMSTTLQGLATATYYFYVVGYDSLGNASPLSAPVQFLYDGVPPAFSINYDKASPVGVGPVHVILSASKALNGLPTMTVQPYGFGPSVLPLTNTALNTFESSINVTTLLPSGPVQVVVSAADLAGNTFNGSPSGPQLVIDVTPPAGIISTAPQPPIQTTNNPTIAVNLQLTKPPQAGTTPTLNFGPPIGAPVPVTLNGSGTNWTGNLQLTSGMGSGIGHLTLSVTDSLGNVGNSINAGTDLELYNTPLPTPPGQPVHFEAMSLISGKVELTWSNVPTAEIYRVYSETGTTFVVPAVLIADNITSNYYIDLPPVDGYYRYVVTALRRGAEGTNSIVRVALSDRTPPPAPTNVVLQLAATGLQISWQAGLGEVPDHFNVYRNGTLIRTVSTVTPVIDNPPQGIMNYTVSAADVLGNEAFSSQASIQLLVGAIDNLQVLVTNGQAPVLTWASPDPSAVGFNIYRNGIKQNNSLLSAGTYLDPLPQGSVPVTYAITAVNSTNAESVARSVTVFPLNLNLLVNAAGGTTSGPPVTAYFDDYLLSVTNLAVADSFPLQQVEVYRSVSGTAPYDLVVPVNLPIGVGNFYSLELPVPSASNTVAQTVLVRAVQQTDAEGSSVVYQQSFAYPIVQTPGAEVELSANQLPLAGGLTPFNVQVFNRGLTPIYLATTRNSGTQPGDVYISVQNQQGQEVSRTAFNGAPPGILFSSGTGYLVIPPGGSTNFTVPNVLVPLSQASNLVTFQAVVSAIYDRATSDGQQQSGPLFGSMQSTLSQTPYYGTAQTDQALYSNDQPVIISGQALDQITGLAVPNVPLKIGFATRGYQWYYNVTTDTNGNYSYTFDPPVGLSGTLQIWAAHPDVFDQLNQVQITIYRIYASPANGDIRMSKNDTLPFNITLINPGDLALGGFTVSFQGYQVQGTNQVPISTLHGTGLFDTNFSLSAGQRQTITLQLAADATAPDNAIGVFTISSSVGAMATFTANVTLLPAVPIISVVQPDVGYLEVSLDRGTLLSGQVTIKNTGLKDLKGVSIIPPTNSWIVLNLPASTNGTIPLPDLAVGQSNTFTVVFTPPTNTDLGFYQDQLTVTGTNAQAGFTVNLYARVTSSQVGAIQFYVEDILGLPVPNATVRLRNTDLQVELPGVQTDINGLVTVTNLQEGNWSWQLTGAGYSALVGVANVIADQTIQIGPPATRLSRSLVTVSFSVVPVPYTDRYEITIEQTFETHVTAPVLVLDPTYLSFDQVQPGFEANFLVTAKNYGLIAINDVKITGSDVNGGQLTPLIDYLPKLLPDQSVQIPFRVTYSASAPSHLGLAVRQDSPCDPGFNAADCLTGNLIQTACGLMGLNAIAAGAYSCYNNPAELIGVAQGLLVGLTFYYAVLSPVNAVVNAFGCLVQGIASLFASAFNGNGGPGSGGGPAGSVGNYEPVGGGCFAAETRVLMADGRLRRIDQVKPGELVRSGSGIYHEAIVAETHTRSSENAREIRYRLPGESEPQVLRATDEHFFWVDGKGWIKAADLRPTDWLFDEDGRRVQVIANEPLKGPLQVYTLKLQGDVAFYANHVMVHDLCGPWTSQGPIPVNWTPPHFPSSTSMLSNK